MLLTPDRPSRALILDADRPLAFDGLPVALADVEGVPLLQRQCEALCAVGVSDIVVVCGDEHPTLLRTIVRQPCARHLFNPFSKIAGCAGALWFAQDELDGDLLIVEGHAVVSAGAAVAMAAGVMPISIAVTMSSAQDGGDIIIEGGLARAFCQKQGDIHPDARALGLAGLRGPGTDRLREALLPTLRKPDGLSKTLCGVLTDLADEVPVGFTLLDGHDCVEHDFALAGPQPIPASLFGLPPKSEVDIGVGLRRP
jgi:hypothetical protein